MDTIVIAVGLAILLGGAFFLARRSATPSLAMWQQIQNAIRQLERTAVNNICSATDPGTIRGFDPDEMADQVINLHNTIRFIYTVEKNEKGFLHAVSSQLLQPKSEKYQIECMLVVMLVLNQRLGECGIKQDEVSFDLDQSKLGTHYVYMLLSPQQHKQYTATA